MQAQKLRVEWELARSRPFDGLCETQGGQVPLHDSSCAAKPARDLQDIPPFCPRPEGKVCPLLFCLQPITMQTIHVLVRGRRINASALGFQTFQSFQVRGSGARNDAYSMQPMAPAYTYIPQMLQYWTALEQERSYRSALQRRLASLKTTVCHRRLADESY